MELNSINETLSYLLVRICRGHRTKMSELLSEVGLHPGQELVLACLWKEDGLSQTDLADRLGIQQPTLTKILQRIATKDLLKRQPCKQDSRVSYVYLTKRGKAYQEQTEAIWGQLEQQLTKGFSNEEKNVLGTLLAQMKENIEAE